MSGSNYYEYQAQARGLLTASSVDSLAKDVAPVYRRLLSKWLPEMGDAAIYEVACGPGIMLRHLRAEGYTNLAGSDFSPCQIDLAREAGLPVTLADSLSQLKLCPPASWDCLIAIDFIEHLPKETLVDFLAESYRTLKPGGRLILRAPNGDSPFCGRNLFNDITHIWAYTSIAARALLQMAGFRHVEFADESLASIREQRWLKVPLMKFSQTALRALIRMATREQIQWLSPSIFICASK
jgi:SAM-dependent methyltransferase